MLETGLSEAEIKEAEKKETLKANKKARRSARKAKQEKSFYLSRNLKSNKKASQDNIAKLLSNNVVEITFKRRRWPIKSAGVGQGSPWRRMLATSNWDFLLAHKSTFKFSTPTGSKPRSKKWYKERNLVIVQDLVRQDWRMISLDDYEVVKVVSVNTKDQQEEYIKYYKNLFKKYGKKKLIGFFNK